MQGVLVGGQLQQENTVSRMRSTEPRYLAWPTLMENWPASLHDLSVSSERVIFTREEVLPSSVAGANNRPTIRTDCKG